MRSKGYKWLEFENPRAEERIEEAEEQAEIAKKG